MARFINRIPNEYKDGLKKIISLTDIDLNKLIQVFEETSILLNVRSFNQKIISKIDFLKDVEAKNLVETIGSLYELRFAVDLSVEDFINEIVDVMSTSDDKALKLSGSNLEEFRQKFNALLNIKSLSSRTKAANLIVDNQIIFKDAKIVSDIRPVFGDSVEDQPIGAVIIHKLKIEYDENDELKNFHIALDEKDLISLVGLLKRTQTKSKTLKEFIESSGLSNYDIE